MEKLAAYDGSRFLTTPDGGNTTIGAVIPDVQGDTYQSNIVAGMTELAKRLGWKIQLSREVSTTSHNKLYPLIDVLLATRTGIMDIQIRSCYM